AARWARGGRRAPQPGPGRRAGPPPLLHSIALRRCSCAFPCSVGSRPGAAGSGGGSMARSVLDHGPPRTVLASPVDGKAVRDRLHEKDAVATLGQRLEIGSIVLLGIERLPEVLHLDDQGLVR